MADAEMTRSATEQLVTRLRTLPATHLGTQLEIHVEFNNGMWWAMPHDLSDGILNQLLNGAQQVSFVWNWEETRRGSYQPDGAETSLNRYLIDFDIMQQRDLDNNRARKAKVAQVLAC